MKNIFFFALFFRAVLAFAVDTEASPNGLWLVSSGDAKVEITQKGDELEGRIVWLKEPNNEAGTARLDIKNPDEKLRTRPILEMLLLKGFKKEKSENKWSGGEIYDAKSGKTYKAWLQPAAPNKLRLRGYVGISLFGRTDEWTRP